MFPLTELCENMNKSVHLAAQTTQKRIDPVPPECRLRPDMLNRLTAQLNLFLQQISQGVVRIGLKLLQDFKFPP